MIAQRTGSRRYAVEDKRPLWLSQKEVDELLQGVTANPISDMVDWAEALQETRRPKGAFKNQPKEPDMHHLHLKERKAKVLMTQHILAELRSPKTHIWVKPVLLVTAFCLLVMKL